MTNSNWMVIVRNKGSIELKGIYSTKRAAEFISERVKKTEKLSKDPKVVPTTAAIYPASNKVEDYITNVDKRNNVRALREKVIQYMPKVKK